MVHQYGVIKGLECENATNSIKEYLYVVFENKIETCTDLVLKFKTCTIILVFPQDSC